mmetsp:Transcript_22307/g.65776  ORF Transcript_22307/g.65776 Transcript_22307/m.65776 type:complete len:306 (+) Transcript_22307:1101-2018(+)
MDPMVPAQLPLLLQEPARREPHRRAAGRLSRPPVRERPCGAVALVQAATRLLGGHRLAHRLVALCARVLLGRLRRGRAHLSGAARERHRVRHLLCGLAGLPRRAARGRLLRTVHVGAGGGAAPRRRSAPVVPPLPELPPVLRHPLAIPLARQCLQVRRLSDCSCLRALPPAGAASRRSHRLPCGVPLRLLRRDALLLRLGRAHGLEARGGELDGGEDRQGERRGRGQLAGRGGAHAWPAHVRRRGFALRPRHRPRLLPALHVDHHPHPLGAHAPPDAYLLQRHHPLHLCRGGVPPRHVVGVATRV